jgi:hypothetical protein
VEEGVGSALTEVKQVVQRVVEGTEVKFRELKEGSEDMERRLALTESEVAHIIAGVKEEWLQAVVYIALLHRENGTLLCWGSGVIIDESGVVITCSHLFFMNKYDPASHEILIGVVHSVKEEATWQYVATLDQDSDPRPPPIRIGNGHYAVVLTSDAGVSTVVVLPPGEYSATALARHLETELSQAVPGFTVGYNKCARFVFVHPLSEFTLSVSTERPARQLQRMLGMSSDTLTSIGRVAKTHGTRGEDIAVLRVRSFGSVAASVQMESSGNRATNVQWIDEGVPGSQQLAPLKSALPIPSVAEQAAWVARVGMRVVVIGFPVKGGTQITVTAGVFSGFGKGNNDGNEVLQTDASVNCASSGSPMMCATTGALLGIVSEAASARRQGSNEPLNNVRPISASVRSMINAVYTQQTI